MMINALKKNLKKLLSDQNISAHALEKKAGLKPSAIQNILQGRSKRPGIDVIVAISKELGCTVEDLMDSEDAVQGSVAQFVSPNVPKEWEISVIENISLMLFSELKKRYSFVDRSVFSLLLEESYSYALRTPRKEINRSFISWLAERVLREQKKRSGNLK